MSCTNLAGDLAPFCEPANNTEVGPGDKLIIRWDPSFFGNASTLVQIQADFGPAAGDDPTPLADVGFTSNSLRAATGSYQWVVSDSILNSTAADAGGISAQLYIVAAAADGGVENRTLGPLVRVLPTESGGGESGSGSAGPNLVAIIVPVVLGVLLLMAVVGYLFMKRRNPGWKLRSVFGIGKGIGYGSRKSRAERAIDTGGVAGNGVQMGDLGISGPTSGRNVFREEMRRQEEARV
ncbi:hypothetical protein BKA67DRAFT_659070 [Truncatella angustata]|uniref:Uncharacterized protein n=1 Tax=Truncatella angustata TaxID=152316 RepID=A0A9P8ZY59_9PEZI|nr:uncharacterized protein BKA67DRAFT_659070 [Truncatella angustata]KAH6654798.1 hypothetical protein BKA67DRAFT_659070 [Truncatella angustata]